MSCGPLPPVPDLIPISALRKNSGVAGDRHRERTPSTTSDSEEVMGEQRSRRTVKQPTIDLIDTSRSRGSTSAAPQASTRRARPERHRKSDRRREHKSARKRSENKQYSRDLSQEAPVNPRVNPIFVWVRQEDNRIVDVKCEDYDKRNRILLTKTAQGWRAIPRTETLVPTLKEEANKHRHHHHHRNRKSGKVKRRSTGIQVDADMPCTDEFEAEEGASSPSWSAPVNIESHLPSHTIHVPRKRPLTPDVQNVNSAVDSSAQEQIEECSVSKTCDITPLDNLLAVAELEFNHQIQSGEWDKHSVTDKYDDIDDHDQRDDEKAECKDYVKDLTDFIDTCTENNETGHCENSEPIPDVFIKTEDCDYNEEDDNNIGMDDILTRLEQSLRSPDGLPPDLADITEIDCDPSQIEASELNDDDCIPIDSISSENNEEEFPSVEYPVISDKPSDCEIKETIDITDATTDEYCNEKDFIDQSEANYIDDDVAAPTVESSEVSETVEDNVQEEPTDLTTKSKFESGGDDIGPTDLSVRKTKPLSPPAATSPRPPSHTSETIQSPEPSGIPAVPPSPDHYMGKQKSVYLDSILSSTNQKLSINTDVTIDKEPLDLGKCRESASPTVTCSEEIKTAKISADYEPPAKKCRIDDITLKTLLVPVNEKCANVVEKIATKDKKSPQETPKLLELLTTESETEPIIQLKTLLANSSYNIPDPMLVPKQRLSFIISNPGKEIPKLLTDRPELRLPEALAFPQLLQDPDILVITLKQLETIIQKQSQALHIEEIKSSEISKRQETSKQKPEQPKSEANKPIKRHVEHARGKEQLPNPSKEDAAKQVGGKTKERNGKMSELASDIDAATNAAFNQMLWLPYINQLEATAMAFGNNSEILKILNNMMPPYSGQMPEVMSPLMMTNNNNKFNPMANNFPMPPQVNYNPHELSLWQEAMVQANLLKQRSQYEQMSNKNMYRDYAEKMAAVNSQNKMAMANAKANFKQPKQNVHNFFPPSMHNIHENFMANPYQTPKPNLQIPQYNPGMCQKPYQSKHFPANQSGKHYWEQQAQNKSSNMNKHFPLHDEKKHTSKMDMLSRQAPKLSCKSFANMNYEKAQEAQKRINHETPRHVPPQPMDLSGATTTTTTAKLKVKDHLIDPNLAPKLLKHDDIPEVGSTTASIEEMQDAQKHLWHPLFGNQKNYNSPWNWTTVTATGE